MDPVSTTSGTGASPRAIALSMGDPLGIGPEVLLKSIVALQSQAQRFPTGLGLRVFGDCAWMQQLAVRLGYDPMPLGLHGACGLPETKLPTPESYCPGPTLSLSGVAIQWEQVCSVPTKLLMGSVDAAAGRCAVLCVEAAAKAVLAGNCRALVTAPLSKQAIALAGYPYPGHTELLAHLAGGVPVRMMLMNRHLRTVLLSVHLALREALNWVTAERLLETLQIADRSLERMLNRRPRLRVAGLNPHAGEAGAFGREEMDIIRPCIERARTEGIDVDGPFSPDTVFARAWDHPEVDAVIAMYHDQGLIPIKLSGLDQGVNLTLGLPFVRTSPDHGTAPDIAGKGLAREQSMIEAILAAHELSGKLGACL